MTTSTFSFADLEKFQEDGPHTAASQNFNQDEIERKRRVYAQLVQTYHGIQMVDTEGCVRITLESLNHRVIVAGSLVDIFGAFVEPLLAQLAGLERQIIAMRAGLAQLNEDTGGGPLPETDAIMAACLPDAPRSLPMTPSSQAA
ncbi:hypothetical protein [Hymenobacter fodinae]|uniref:Uncharacterized protein n=1 Tax=Hymenobacter fodinae TaxID=2510796 RepID=A0A4Z0NZD2_9BACT|nr:hypothetical protein [Hymenobacter fodinae]TGE03335.1 hypothetical protein EU556_25810 [Hymenobacter fodinae]